MYEGHLKMQSNLGAMQVSTGLFLTSAVETAACVNHEASHWMFIDSLTYAAPIHEGLLQQPSHQQANHATFSSN